MKDDPVERIKRREDPSPELYQRLSGAQAGRIINHVLHLLMEGDRDEGERILLELAAFTGAPLGPVQRLLAEDDPHPSLAFRGADTQVRKRLLEAVEGDSDVRDHALKALAWIGDEQVVERFAAWRLRKTTRVKPAGS